MDVCWAAPLLRLPRQIFHQRVPSPFLAVFFFLQDQLQFKMVLQCKKWTVEKSWTLPPSSNPNTGCFPDYTDHEIIAQKDVFFFHKLKPRWPRDNEDQSSSESDSETQTSGQTSTRGTTRSKKKQGMRTTMKEKPMRIMKMPPR